MNYFGWIQLALFVGLLLALTKPMGVYLTRVLDVDGKTFLDPIMRPVERLFYFLLGIDPQKRAGLETVFVFLDRILALLEHCLPMRFFDYSISYH